MKPHKRRTRSCSVTGHHMEPLSVPSHFSRKEIITIFMARKHIKVVNLTFDALTVLSGAELRTQHSVFIMILILSLFPLLLWDVM